MTLLNRVQAPSNSYQFNLLDEYYNSIDITKADSYECILTNKMQQWENTNNIWCDITCDCIDSDLYVTYDVWLIFKSEADAIIFKLSWGT